MGKAPDLRSKARSVTSWKEKLPEIIPFPEVIASLIEGALTISPSKTIANLFPTLSVVALPNFCAPNLSSVNETVGSLFWLLILGWASIKFSPLIIILLLTFNSSPFSESNLSVPNSLFSLTNLKFNWAVLPNKALILSGSFKPGSSIKILFSPRCKIVGSFVPTSSILLLTISMDCLSAELLIVSKPNLENEISTLSLEIFL